MDWIVAGAVQNAGRWMIGVLLIGLALGFALFVGVPWLWDHIIITVK